MRKIYYYLVPLVIFALLISPSLGNLYSVNAQILPGPPSPPTNLTATAVSSSEIDLNWNAPSNGGLLLSGYMIERSTDSGTTWSTIASNTGSTATTYSDTGLTASTSYTYRVSAINSVGTSSPSNTASATTSGSTSTTQVTISVNSVDLSGNPINGMSVVIRYTNGTTISDTFTPASFTVASGTTYVVHVRDYQTNVFNHWQDGSTNSYYTITPTQNVVLTAYYSTSGPAPTVPSAPQNLQATGGNTQISLSWTAPSSNGGSAITNYKIYRSTSSGTETLLATTGNVVSYTDDTVTNGQTYFYKVTAVNSVGESLQSNEASATSASSSTAPQPPTGLAAMATSSSQINLSWTAPSNNGGSAITGYKIERSTDSGTTWNAIVANTATTSTAYSDTGLTASTAYTYRVSAINSVGTSSPSNTASATTQSSTCSTCQLTVTTQLATGGSLTGIYVELDQNGQKVSSGFSPATFTLNNGAQYTVAVGSFGTYTFAYWLDSDSTTNPRPVSISNDTQLTAIYTDSAVILSPSRGSVGTTVSVTGAPSTMTFTTFSPNHTITLTWDGTSLTTNPSTITSNSTGGFSATFKVPNAASSGSHKVTATDGTNTHSTLFTVGTGSTVSLNTSTVNVGTGVRVTGSNFTPTSQITILYDGTAIGVGQQNVDSGSTIPSTITTDSSGNFVAIISVLRSVAGTHTISAQDSANTKATHSITVIPHVFIYPTSGHAGTQVLIPASQGNGYAANSPITIKFDGTTITSSTTITTDTTGNFGGSFTVPSTAALGSHTVHVSDGKGNTQSISFTVTDPTTPMYKVQSIVSGLNFPDGFAFIPDNGPGVDGSGALMALEKNTGNVIVFKNTNGQFVRQSIPFVTVPNLQTAYETNGLLGIAFDPKWSSSTPSKFVYFYVTRTVSGSVVGELIRYHATTDQTTGNIVADQSIGEQLVFGNIPAWQNGHNGGHLKFDSQGNLYMSTGDGWTFVVGQDLTTLQAKILRITPLAIPDTSGKLYSIPSDNPFASSTNTSIKKEIWGYGVRNPFTFDIDSQTGKLYASDPGFNTWERIENLTAAGSNVGWPNYEAPPYGNPQNLANYTPPVYWFPHQGMEPIAGSTAGLEALSAGAFYRCSTNCYTPNLQGAYFFGDYGVGFIAALLPSSTAPPQIDPASGVPKGQIVPIYYGLTVAPITMQVWNGQLYFLDLNGNLNVLNYN